MFQMWNCGIKWVNLTNDFLIVTMIFKKISLYVSCSSSSAYSSMNEGSKLESSKFKPSSYPIFPCPPSLLVVSLPYMSGTVGIKYKASRFMDCFIRKQFFISIRQLKIEKYVVINDGENTLTKHAAYGRAYPHLPRCILHASL